MLARTQRALYKVYGGKVFMDVQVQSTLEPHAEKFKLDNIQVDPNVTGLVLPLEAGASIPTSRWMETEVKRHEPLESLSKDQLIALGGRLGWNCKGRGKGELINGIRLAAKKGGLNKAAKGGNLLKEVFKSWPRLYHQKEFERPYLTKRINVLELGPFEVMLEGLIRPLVTNVQFSNELPLTPSGTPDVRIGLDIARRSHYLHPELASEGLIGSLSGTDYLNLSKVAPYGAPPMPTPGKSIPGSHRLYPDDKVRPHLAVVDGAVRAFPRTALSEKPSPLPQRQWARRVEDHSRSGAAGVPPPTTVAASEKQKKKWEGWGA